METFCQGRTEGKRKMFYRVEAKQQQKKSCQRTSYQTPNKTESLQRRQSKKISGIKVKHYCWKENLMKTVNQKQVVLRGVKCLQ